MSRNFYFKKWKEILVHLKELVDTDIEYQVTKAHDRTLPEAVHRLSGVLGQYILIYNNVMECVQQNLQVQKTVYLNNIVNAIVSRILELKQELGKLEGSNIQFIGHGLIEVHHTIMDTEMTAIPMTAIRPEHIQAALEEILATAKEKKEEMKRIANVPEEIEESIIQNNCWWDAEETKSEKEKEEKQNKVDEIPEEIRKTREYLAMIFAHEKTRQVTRRVKVNELKRERWEKELKGLLQPPARYEIREKGAKIIQEVFRAYFQLKRDRIKNAKRDELLGLIVCETPIIDKERKTEKEMLQNRSNRHQIYEKEWLARREDLKKEFLKLRKAQLCEEFREQIREWFIEWFESVNFFKDIPKDGSSVIFKGLISDPYNWIEENKALITQNEANKKKNPQDLKFEKMEAKRLAKMLKKEEQMANKAEALLLKKMMKNPTMHPGYKYPPSKRTDNLLEVIDQYHKFWDNYDKRESIDVKEKYVHRVDIEDIIMEAKLEVLPEVDEHMRKELQRLKKALTEDYKNNEEDMPVDVTKPVKGEKKKKKFEAVINERTAEMIEYLAIHGFLIEYPKTKLEDYTGDANFGGEDLRSQVRPALPFNYEIRAFWWERCREVSLGLRKILLVGPQNSGKNKLVHALASINDAVLFELDPYNVQGELLSAPYLKLLSQNVVSSAKALQPSVIHIKHVQKLFYTKTPPEEEEMNFGLIKTYFVQKLIKKFRKTDQITVIGSCTDPWLAKSSALLKQFPVVLLLPNTTYSLVVQMLKEWVVKHPVIPPDFNVSNLAQVLQGYTFGYLKDTLDKFMSADRILKIAAFGLTPMDVYDYVLEDETGVKIEYDKYLKWYGEKTTWGKKERQHLQDQIEFKAAVEKYAAKNKKKKAKSAPSSTTGSYTGL